MNIRKLIKRVFFIQAYEDRKAAIFIKNSAVNKYRTAYNKTEELKAALNAEIQEFGRIRLSSLQNTIGTFLSFLRDIEQKNKVSQYEILEAINIKHEKLAEIKSLEMSASKLMATTIASGAFGTVALTGVPALVTGTVSTLATASTGTAISSLSGAAATNATMAWLGGGAISAGGGGIAAGTAVLATATYVTTGAFAALVGGIIASAHYSQKLTQVTEYSKNVDIQAGELEKVWIVIEGISTRVKELKDITNQITSRALAELRYLTPLIPDFNFDDIYHKEVFQRNGILIKAVGELARVQVLNDEGGLSESAGIVTDKIKTLLNTQL